MSFLQRLGAVALWVLAATASAQPAAEPRPLQLALHGGGAVGLDGEQLRGQLERELGVAVVLAAPEAAPDGATLRVDAESLQAVRVSVGESERTVDLSTSGPHAVETLALLAAAMMRDEARDLLATLRAAQPPAPAPAVAPASAPAPAEPRGCASDARAKRVPLAANLVPYAGTSSVTGLDVQQTFALNAIGGAARSTRGAELAGVFNLESRALCGAQVAGVANIVSGPVQGAQLAFLNIAGGRVDGAQVAFVNTADGSLHGLQLGFVDVASEAVGGGQVGFVNVAAQTVDGAQVGFVNTAAGDTRGLQLGFVNVASAESRGLMLGFVNVAGDAGAAIGLVSVYARGRTQLDVWGTDAGLLMAGVEHGGRRFHNLYGAGFTARNGRGVFAFAWGLGARVYDQRPFHVDVDAVAYGLLGSQPSTTEDGTDETNLASIFQLRVPIGYRIAPAVSFFAAPSLSISVARTEDELHDPGLYGAQVTSDTADVTAVIWPGLSLGARFF